MCAGGRLCSAALGPHTSPSASVWPDSVGPWHKFSSHTTCACGRNRRVVNWTCDPKPYCCRMDSVDRRPQHHSGVCRLSPQLRPVPTARPTGRRQSSGVGQTALRGDQARERAPRARRTGVFRGVQRDFVQLAEERLWVQGHGGPDAAERQRLHADPHVPVRNQRCDETTQLSVSVGAADVRLPPETTRPTAAAAPSRPRSPGCRNWAQGRPPGRL